MNAVRNILRRIYKQNKGHFYLIITKFDSFKVESLLHQYISETCRFWSNYRDCECACHIWAECRY
jgi:hypothetical protein